MYFRYVQCSGEHVYKDRFKVIDLVLTGLSEVEKSHRWSWCVQKQHWSTSPITLFCFSCSKFFFFFFWRENIWDGRGGDGEALCSGTPISISESLCSLNAYHQLHLHILKIFHLNQISYNSYPLQICRH